MTLLTKKFNYEELKKESVNGKRLYACPDGNSVASVTTILDKTKDKTGLIEWRKSCLLYTSPSPRDATLSRMPSSA